ncbi:glycoside hydrolase family 3 protein [Melanomma pulvis-pyrius CBS 109.77]|uniref:beta-glucosidase n=1 Tax=Melanomma pulvis-pyrius CBS 109.77 TaxID=1314802 RepID=A0A6A6XJ76_9PLEO|nr:glycoside hydrolase family 3 protein [Melanomma pulvis-pyrius CBS 109.77]
MASNTMATSDRFADLLRHMTLEEKVLLLGGKNMWETESIPRLGIKSLKTTDGPAGVRGAKWTGGTRSTYIPCGVSLGATFDPNMIESIGRILGEEAKSKNAHVLLAPTMNMSRSPLGGRNFENFGEDPFLTGTLATSIVRGIQSQGVGACPKHFVGNEQESRRFNIDEKIDERTLREVYLRPFQMVCEAEPWTFMTAYNKINGEHCDVSKTLIQDILRQEWGFRGIVMSDWGGLNDTVQSLIAGTDLEMPGPPIRRATKLLEAVNAGLVKETDVDLCVERMLQLLEKASCLEQPGQDTDDDVAGDAAAINADEGSADRIEVRLRAKEAAVGGMVLLKNNGILPLSASDIKSLAIIGPNAATPTIGGAGSAVVNPYYISTPFESISAIARAENPDMKISYECGIRTHKMLPLPGDLIKSDSVSGVRLDFFAGHNFKGDVVGSRAWATTQIMMMSDGDIPETLRGKEYSFKVTGTLTAAESGTHSVGICSTGKAKLFIDNVLVVDNSNWTELGEGFMNCGSKERISTIVLEKGHTYAIRIDQVAVPPPIEPHDNTLFHTVSGIRFGLLAPVDEEAMFSAAVKSAQDADVAILVVGHNNGTERESVDRTSLSIPGNTAELVRAISAANKRTIVVNQSACAVDLHAWRETPAALIQAWYQGQETGNAIADVLFGKANPSGKLPITFPIRLEDHGSHKWFPGDVDNDRAEYGEGTLIGYRWFDKHQIQPAWEFGYGGSYTTFALADIKSCGTIGAESGTVVTISVSVTNNGDVAGAEVIQVYASPSAQLAKLGLEAAPTTLVGFKKVFIKAKKSEVVSIEIGRNAVEWYDAKNSLWVVDQGIYKFHVGTSSRNIKGIVDVEVTI